MHKAIFVAAVLAALPAMAEGFPDRISRLFNGGDSALIQMVSEHEAELTYWNAEEQNSMNGTATLQIGDVVVDLIVEVGGGDGEDELAIVLARDGWMALPPQASVKDGEGFSFRILPGMF